MEELVGVDSPCEVGGLSSGSQGRCQAPIPAGHMSLAMSISMIIILLDAVYE